MKINRCIVGSCYFFFFYPEKPVFSCASFSPKKRKIWSSYDWSKFRFIHKVSLSIFISGPCLLPSHFPTIFNTDVEQRVLTSSKKWTYLKRQYSVFSESAWWHATSIDFCALFIDRINTLTTLLYQQESIFNVKPKASVTETHGRKE